MFNPRSGADLEVEMEVDHLAEFMFLKNVNNAVIELSLNGLQNTKDFFFFCLDLFCKGLIFLFAPAGATSVNINDLSVEQFGILRDKMRLAGLDVTLDVQPPDVDIGPDDVYMNLQELYTAPDELPMKDYKFMIKCSEFTYMIHFDIFHRSDGNCHSTRTRVL
jgi:hypothetical protein